MAANDFELNVTRARALAEVANSIQYHLEDMHSRVAQYAGYLAAEMEKPEGEQYSWQIDDYNESMRLYQMQADLWEDFIKTLRKKIIA